MGYCEPPSCTGSKSVRVRPLNSTASLIYSTIHQASVYLTGSRGGEAYSVQPAVEIESFDGGNYFSETLTRAKFQESNMDLFRKTMKPVEQVLKDADVKKGEIDEMRFLFFRSCSSS